jgi:hypothetical protein
MTSIRQVTSTGFALLVVALFCCGMGRAQAALLMEEPYGFFGALNPTGHDAIYFARVCAETPVKLRRCQPGEAGAVIARYQGIDGYDWIAIPLIPYLYSVESAAEVPAHVDRATVARLRNHYREAHLETLGDNLPPGGFTRGGWTQLIGAAYERRIYALRFNTTEAQDDALIARMNNTANRTQFNLLYENCADFARVTLNTYFPHTFHRSIFPDAGMTTPKQIAYELARYARKHPETGLTVFAIPQVPGYRHSSHPVKGIDESFVTTFYAAPIALLNPYLAGCLFVDYAVRGRYRVIPKHPPVLSPETLEALSAPLPGQQNAVIAAAPADSSASAEPGASASTGRTPSAMPGEQLPAAASGGPAPTPAAGGGGMNGIEASHE